MPRRLPMPTYVAALLVGSALTCSLASAQVQPDPAVRAFREAYAPFIDSVTYRDGDVVFAMRGRSVRFDGGRMLDESRLDRRASCDPVFYRYSIEPLRQAPVPATEFPTSCRDVLEILWGSTETEVRRHCSPVAFLDHRMIVNDVLIAPLQAVERDVRELSSRDAAVAEWIAEIEITYSFINRDISSSDTPSFHSWGLAFDLVPRSYEGRHAYWRWSRAMDREGWQDIPLEARWSPPPSVVEIFERHGFVWGGKWGYFDTIHFEYRPEILAYNRLLEGR
ncbi:MAG: M15 family metallopeptidase [Gemmatimonadales bacterium]